MGCDIHLYAEVKKKKNFIEKLMFWKPKKWVNIDKWSKNKDYPNEDNYEPEFIIKREHRFYTGGRLYNLFSALCGVINYHFNGILPKISKPKGVPDDVSLEIKKEIDRWDGDGHSHSWNTLEELKSFDWSEYGNTCNDFLEEVIPKMEKQGVNPSDVRIVYFFDN